MPLLPETQLIQAIHQAFQKYFGLTLSLSDLVLQPTHPSFQGDYTFVTFPWATRCKQEPTEVAQQLGVALQDDQGMLATFNVAGGFLNMTLPDALWVKQLMHLSDHPHFGLAPPNGKKVVVEFASPNTNKPLHLGHLRNICLGHAVAELLKAAGYTVYKVNLVNDRGIHICKSMVAYRQFGQGTTPETSGTKGDHLVGYYYVKFEQVYRAQVADLTSQWGDAERAAREAPVLREAQHMLWQWEQGDAVVRDLWSMMNGWVYRGFEATYRQLGVAFDKTYYESDTYLLGKQVVEEALAQDILYRRKDGSVWADLTQEGLDHKLVLRADGTSVYMTQDLGVADLRYADYLFDRAVYVVGNEQDYHFEVLFKLLGRLGRPYAPHMFHLSYGMVALPTGKMKSREGTVVDADQLIEEMVDIAARHTRELGKVGDLTQEASQQLFHMLAMGALKYFLLRSDAGKRILFDPQASIDFQGHTGPYIQYTHARIATLLRKASSSHVVDHGMHVLPEEVTLHPTERTVILQLCRFSEIILNAADAYAPAMLAQYLFDLAKAYNRLYGATTVLAAATPPLRAFRLRLSTTVARVLRQGMGILGIEVPERM